MVEGKNEARAQWIGRTSQNKTLNFTAPGAPRPERELRSGDGHHQFSQQPVGRNGGIRG